MAKQFHLWVGGDAHVGTDIRQGYASLATALSQSEGPKGFPWDIMLDVGDLSGGQFTPDEAEGEEVRAQYGVLRQHHRSQIYNVCGNHDATGPRDLMTQWWFRQYGDPLGEHPGHSGVDLARRPYPVTGQWDHYAFTAGNIRFLMMSDRNDGGPPVGRGAKGGYPAGAVSRATFDWWRDQVASHQDHLIVSLHHHMLKETTVASGEWEGFHPPDAYGNRKGKYHGYFKDGGPMGASYLYWVDGHPDAQAFERHLAAQPGAIDLWLGGHTHSHPDDVLNGRSHVERKWGVNFVNCAALTRHHNNTPKIPMSRLFSFTEGVAQVRVQCYLHTDHHAPQGFYPPAERHLPLRHAFRLG